MAKIRVERFGLEPRRWYVSRPYISLSASFSSLESDYAIFVWRQKSLESQANPILYLHDPNVPLPSPPQYVNPSYYAFKPPALSPNKHPRANSRGRSVKSAKTHRASGSPAGDGIPQFKKDFMKFHNENGVRTVIGSIGPVENGSLYNISAFMLRFAYLTPCSSHAA